MIEALAGKAIGGLFGGLGSALGGGGGPFMGGNAQSGAYGVTLDKAGMVFNFGNGNSTATRSDRTTEAATPPAIGYQLPAEPVAPMQAGVSWLAMGALALVALGMWKRAQK